MVTAKSVGHSSCFRESWLHEHHRVCSLLHPFFNHRPIRKVKVRRPVKDPYARVWLTCVKSRRRGFFRWRIPRAWHALTETPGRAESASKQFCSHIGSWAHASTNVIRPRCRPRCVVLPGSIHVHACMTGNVLFTALDKTKTERRSSARHAAAVTRCTCMHTIITITTN